MGRPDLTVVLLSMRNSCSTIEDAFRFEIDTHFVITEVFSIETLRPQGQQQDKDKSTPVITARPKAAFGFGRKTKNKPQLRHADILATNIISQVFLHLICNRFLFSRDMSYLVSNE